MRAVVSAKRVHFVGGLRVATARCVVRYLPGFPVCTSGDAAQRIADDETRCTYDVERVTCARCRAKIEDRARVVSRRRSDPYTERALREHARVVETLHEWRERWSRHDVQTVLVVRTRDGLRVLDFDARAARATAYDVREDELEVVVQVLDTLAKRRSLFNVGATMPRRALQCRYTHAWSVASGCDPKDRG